MGKAEEPVGAVWWQDIQLDGWERFPMVMGQLHLQHAQHAGGLLIEEDPAHRSFLVSP